MTEEKEHYLKQLIYELRKTNNPPNYGRISSLIYDGKIDVTLPVNGGLSIIDQIHLSSHINHKYKKEIINICDNLPPYSDEK